MKKWILTTSILILIVHISFAQTIVQVNSSEAQEILNDIDKSKTTIIDGRTSEMFDEGHIYDAININAFSENVNKKLKKFINKKQLVIYCTKQNRAKTIIGKLKELNYTGNIIFIQDGITGWKDNGFNVVSDDQRSKKQPEKSSPLDKLTPVMQVFGAGSYDTENNHYGYSFGRAHLGFEYQFNDKWSAKMIIDRGRPTTVSDIRVIDSAGNPFNVEYTANEGSYYTMWLKFANLKWQVNDRLSLTSGALLQNHYITQEKFWGLRYVAKTFQDMYWHIPSTDLGFRANYKINDLLSFDAALTNGEGPRVQQDPLGNVKYAAGLDITPNDIIQTRLYYHNQPSGIDTAGTEQLFSAFAGIRPFKKFRIGGEFNYMQNLNSVESLNSCGYSLYSAYAVMENTEIFARYDNLNYEATENPMTEEQKNGSAIIGGISFSPVQGVKLSLNYRGWMAKTSNNNLKNSVHIDLGFKL